MYCFEINLIIRIDLSDFLTNLKYSLWFVILVIKANNSRILLLYFCIPQIFSNYNRENAVFLLHLVMHFPEYWQQNVKIKTNGKDSQLFLATTSAELHLRTVHMNICTHVLQASSRRISCFYVFMLFIAVWFSVWLLNKQHSKAIVSNEMM